MSRLLSIETIKTHMSISGRNHHFVLDSSAIVETVRRVKNHPVVKTVAEVSSAIFHAEETVDEGSYEAMVSFFRGEWTDS